MPANPESLIKDCLPVGKKHCLYGNARNNMAESLANLFGHNNIRNLPPSYAVVYFLKLFKSQLDDYMKEIKTMVENKSQFTTIGERIFKDFQGFVAFCANFNAYQFPNYSRRVGIHFQPISS